MSPPHPLVPPSGRPTPTRVDRPDVSFVIPVYNAEPWLEACVVSALAQTQVHVEVICVDDGSTDRSREILRRLAQADPRVTIIDQPNSGQSVARNRGLDAATGRYLVYLDSDDYWSADVLSKLVRRADREHLDVLMFDCAAFPEGDIDETTWRWYSTYYQRSRPYVRSRSGAQLMADMRRNTDYRPHVGLYLARTGYVRDTSMRFIPGIVHQDNPYTFRLLLNARRVAHLAVDAYARRIRPGSTITSLTSERSAKGYFLSFVEMNREVAARELPVDITDPIHNIVGYVWEGARKQFSLLSDQAVDEIGELDRSADAVAAFNSLKTGVPPAFWSR